MEFLRKTITSCPYTISSSVRDGIELETYFLIPDKFQDEVLAVKSYIITRALRHPIKWAFVWPRRFARRKFTYTRFTVSKSEVSSTGARSVYELEGINSWQRVVRGEIVIWSTAAAKKSNISRTFMAVITDNTVVIFSNSKEGMEMDDRQYIETLELRGPGTVINFDIQVDGLVEYDV